MPGENNNNNNGANGGNGAAETVAKSEFEAKVQESEKLKQELEDMRLEVFSPNYMEFLESKEKGGKSKTDDKPKEEGKVPIDFEKLSKTELLALAKQQAKDELKADIEKAKLDAVDTVGKSQRQREVAAFARSHEDYETYRPIMYGLSLDPKNKDLSLQELYDKSKDHVKRIHTEPSKEEKERQRLLASEKPGGSSESYEKYSKMSPEQTAKESLDEVKAKLGPIPTS